MRQSAAGIAQQAGIKGLEKLVNNPEFLGVNGDDGSAGLTYQIYQELTDSHPRPMQQWLSPAEHHTALE